MIEFFDGLTHWHWLGLAVAVLGARALMPFGMACTLGRGVLALGLAAGTVGLALTAAPDLTGAPQLALAVVASVASAYSLNWWAARGYRRAEQHLGQIFALTQAIVAGRGWLDIEGESWPIRGDNLPAGAMIKVVGITEMVQVAELRHAGDGMALFDSGARVKVVGTDLALQVEPA
ncbi:MAG: hypothetical protein ACTSQ7_17590 [Alphaproteobacteria bacterium]